MIKKVICLSLIVLLLFALAGCSGMEPQEENQESSSMFVIIEHSMNHGCLYTVVYHKETKVMYALDQYNHFTVIVDIEGKPLIWDGEN